MASQFSIKLSVSAADLIKSIKQTIDDINTGDKLKNKPLNISASAAKLRESIRAAIDEINSGDKLKSKPINISASESFLKKSIRTAIDNINASNSLASKPVKLNAKIDTKSLAQQLQAQIANATAKASTINVGANTNAATLKESVNAITNAINSENSAIETTNSLLKEQQKLFLKTGDVKLTQTYGTSGQTVANTYLNGNQVTQTITNDFSRQQKEADKAYAAYSRLDSIINKLQADFADPNAVKPIREQANIDELNSALTETRSKIEAVKTASAESFSKLKADADSAIASLKLLINTRQNEEYAANILRAVDVPTAKAIQTNYFDELTAKINSSRVPLSELTNDLNVLQMLLNNITDRNSLTAYLNQLSITEAKFDSLKAKAKETSDFSKQITADLKKLNSLTNGTIFKHSEDNTNVVRLREQINSLIDRYQALRSASSPNATPEQMAGNIEILRELQTELQSLTQSTAAVRENLRNTKIDDNLLVKIQRLNAQISEFVRKNGKAMNTTNPLTGNTFGEDVNNIQGSLSSIQTVEVFDKVNRQFQILRSNIKAVGAEGNTMLSELGGKLSKFVKWFGVTYLFTKARMYFNKLFATVYELDTALIDLKKTFNGTNAELEDFYRESNNLAKQLGVTTQEIISQAAAWSRLGYSSNETMKKMAEMSSMFAAISPDMNTEQAQNGLVSIMKAFKINPEDTLDGILSKVNIIGNTAATSNGEIVEMLQKSSAAMKEANNTLEETIALETAAVEITRDSASTGTAWKTISARLRGLDEETLQVSEDITELTGKFADFTKTSKTPGGISLFTDENRTTYKSTYQIIKELSEIWDNLTDVQTARIEEVMGGKRQLQVVSAVIENFDAAEQALDNMANSAGNAESEMEVIRESAAYALNELKETFTALAQDSISRDFLKNLIKTGTGLVSVLDTLVKTFGALPVVIGAAAGAITAFKKKGEGLLGNNAKGNLTFLGADTSNGIKSWFNEKTDPTGAKTQIKYQMQAVKAFDNAIKTNQMNLRTYNAVMQSSNDNVKRYGRAVMQGVNSTQAFKKVNGQLRAEMSLVGKNTKIAATGVKQLNAAMKTLNTIGSMVVSMGISWAIGKVFEAISDAVNSIENNISRIKDLNSEISGIESEIKDLNEQLVDTKTRIAELQGMPKLTLLEQDELNRLIQSNDELERQIRLKRGQLAEDLNENHQKALDVLKEMTTPPDIQSDKWWNYIPLPGIKSIINLIVGANKEIKNLSLDDQLADLEEYKNVLQEINDIKASDEYEKNSSKFDKEITEKEDKLGELSDKIYTYYTNI